MRSAEGTARRAFYLLVLATALTRVAAVLWLRTWLGDAGAYEHDAIARSIVAGDGFQYAFFSDVAEPSGHQAPAMPMLLALGYALFGSGSAGGRLFVELLNVGLAVIAVIAIGQLAKRWWGERVMRIAMAGFAIYPAFVYMPTRIQAVNWALPFLLLIVLGFVVLGESAAPRRAAILTGIVGGLAALGEPILAAPFALCWLWFAWSARRDLRPPLVVALACALTLTPWMVRNAIALDRPGFVKSSFWYVAWQGNHIGASGTDKLVVAPATRRALAWRSGGGPETEGLLDAARQEAVSVDIALSAADSAALRALPSERARMQWFGARLRSDLAAEPMAYVAVSARRLAMLFWFDPTNPRSFVLAYRAPYLVLAALALFGLVLIARQRAPLGFQYWALGAGGLWMVHTLVIASARFRLPIEALYLLPAAVAVDALVRGTWRYAHRPAPLP